MKPLKRPGLLHYLRNWFGYWLYRRMGVRSGPFMFSQGWAGEWMMVDHRGNIWCISYDEEGAENHSCPVRVSIYKEAP